MKSLSFTIPSARLPYQLHCLLWLPDNQDIPLSLAHVPQSYDEEHNHATCANAPARANHVSAPNPVAQTSTISPNSVPPTLTTLNSVAFAQPAQPATPAQPALPRVRGTIQLMHGMCEHLGRYSHVARQLTAQGYVVFGMDMPGHGKSVPDSTQLGHIPLDEDVDGLLADEHALFTLVNSCYDAATPHFLLGHSLGSFLARAFLARFKPDVRAVALIGAGQVSPVLRTLGSALTRLLVALRNDQYRSRFIDALGAGAYAKAFQPARTPFDWLSRNPQVVDAYLRDPLCGAPFSVASYLVTSHILRVIAVETPLIFAKQCTDQVLQASQSAGTQQESGTSHSTGTQQLTSTPRASNVSQPRVQRDGTCTVTSFTCAYAPSSDAFSRVAILFCSGVDDVVGNRGKGVMQAAKSLVKAGFSRVTVRLYNNARHEVLNEDCAPDVVSAIVAWFDDAALSYVPAGQSPTGTHATQQPSPAQPSPAHEPTPAQFVPAGQPPAEQCTTQRPSPAPAPQPAPAPPSARATAPAQSAIPAPSVPPRQKA